MIDFHCHLDLYQNPERVIKECEEQGIYVLSVTNTPSAWPHTSFLAANAKRIRTALGLHPQLAKERIHELSIFEELIPGTKYLGEIGLDGSPECKGFWKEQTKVFDRILELSASNGGRIMTIHSRNAANEVLNSLERQPDSGVSFLHWFSGTLSELKRAIDFGCWFSIGPPMTSSIKGRQIISRIPKDRILPESDGPFTSIQNRQGAPQDVGIVYKALGEIWGEPIEVVEYQIANNFKKLLEHKS